MAVSCCKKKRERYACTSMLLTLAHEERLFDIYTRLNNHQDISVKDMHIIHTPLLLHGYRQFCEGRHVLQITCGW